MSYPEKTPELQDATLSLSKLLHPPKLNLRSSPLFSEETENGILAFVRFIPSLACGTSGTSESTDV